MPKREPRDKRIVCTRLSKADFEAFHAARAVLGCSVSLFVREAIVAALAAIHGEAYREAFSCPPPDPPPRVVIPPMHIQPRTKAPYRGDGTAVRPVEGQRMGSVRSQGALLKPARPPKPEE